MGRSRRQRGAALMVVLVVLLLLAFMGLTAHRMTGQHLQVVGNAQSRTLASAAAQRAIEQTISSDQFARDPGAVAATPIDTDVDGDGVVDFTAVLDPRPRCTRVRPIKTAELNVAVRSDRVCLQSADAGGMLFIERPAAVVAAGDSLCASSEWDISARVTDAASGALAAVQQGIGIRVAKSDADSFCK
jgi:hypothetical protein